MGAVEMKSTYYEMSKEVSRVMKNSELRIALFPIVALAFGFGFHYFTRKNKIRSKRYYFDTPCIICVTEGRQVIFEPCRHISTCSECAKKLLNCPMCRTPLTNKVLIEDYIQFPNH